MSFLKTFFKSRLPIWIAISALVSAASTQSAEGIHVNDTFPAMGGFKLEGQLPPTASSQILLVDFWASWCAPCKASFPVLDELHRKYSEKGLVVIAVNVDEKRADMELFLKKTPANFCVVRDPEQKLVSAANVATMPTSFLIDTTGRVRFVHSGFKGEQTKKQYIEEIEKLLRDRK